MYSAWIYLCIQILLLFGFHGKMAFFWYYCWMSENYWETFLLIKRIFIIFCHPTVTFSHCVPDIFQQFFSSLHSNCYWRAEHHHHEFVCVWRNSNDDACKNGVENDKIWWLQLSFSENNSLYAEWSL